MWQYIQAERLMDRTRALLDDYPAQALQTNLKAVEIFPYPGMTRAQLALTFQNLLAKRKTRIDPAAADMIFRHALTAGEYAPATLASRLDYLASFGGNGIERILSVMRKNASLQIATWIHEAAQGLRTGDRKRARFAIDEGRRVSKYVRSEPVIMQQFDRMEKAL